LINYFYYYGLAENLNIDQNILRKLYYENSRKFHPDFFTLESKEHQNEVLQQSTLNNEAYNTLKDDNKRLKHLLTVKGAINDNDKEQLSQMFLMEMMDINETIMDAELGEISDERYTELIHSVDKLTNELNSEIQSIGSNSNYDESDIARLKDCYYRKKYITRLMDNIRKLKTP